MRDVTSRLTLDLRAPSEFLLAIAVSRDYEIESETLDVALDGEPVEFLEQPGRHGTRHHLVTAGPGRVSVAYAARVAGAKPAPALSYDVVEYLRPSRYADSDRLLNVARSLFGELSRPPGLDGVERVRQWLLGNMSYVPGATDHIDGATDVFLSRQGVCRDSAHLMVAFLRALGTPARVVSVYAPGLVPMDFHAVVEVLIDDLWYVVDGTGLAPRPSMVRIAVGRDAADTAFLEVRSGAVDLVELNVTATAADGLPFDDGKIPVQLG